MDDTSVVVLSKLGPLVSDLSSETFKSSTAWFNELEKRIVDNSINIMDRKYNASGSMSVYSGSIATGTKVLTINGGAHDYKRGHGISLRTFNGVTAVQTLKVTNSPTTAGKFTINLDGGTLTIPVTVGETPTGIATKIASIGTNGDGSNISQKLDGTGWTATSSGDTVTFQHANQAPKTLGVFNAVNTGLTATFASKTAGFDGQYFETKVAAIDGSRLTLRDVFTGATNNSIRVEHDDTEAVQQAVLDCYARGGGKVLIPSYNFPVRGIKLRSKVVLVGVGWESCLYQRSSSNVDVISLFTPSEQMTGIFDLSINGQKNTQTTGNGINLDNTGGTGFTFYDPCHIVDNVFIQNIKEDGFISGGTRNLTCRSVVVFSADKNGFNITNTDSYYYGCTSANAGTNGWRINSPNSKFVSCKSYGAGRLDSVFAGSGFYLVGHRQSMSVCEAQDNGRFGYFLIGSSGNEISGIFADSNGNRMPTGTSFGVYLSNGASNNRISGNAFNRENYVHQNYALHVLEDCLGNTITLNSPNNKSGNVALGQGMGNDITINSQKGTQLAQYAAEFVPAPYKGSNMIVNLTGNITINKPAEGQYHQGMTMTFVLKQDATGGRTITFSSDYKSNWTPVTNANKVNTTTFIHDGTNWVQTASHSGI
ncbi:hypothetical protein [Paenibacillus sp. Marseille-Q4541]|uniref:hypothetical protein n=1 Tax=Paenibacillus sp. Marseille-Q4541 TaxID=2831522 RepID=UPI001BAC232F|nr:hypothetical protein [Paenibacillus sp. Marseille-Q4541]